MTMSRGIGRRRFLALTAGAAALVALGASQCATLALRNARLFTGAGSPPLDGMTVAVLGAARIR